MRMGYKLTLIDWINLLPYGQFCSRLNYINHIGMTNHILTAGAEMHLRSTYTGFSIEKEILDVMGPIEQIVKGDLRTYEAVIVDLADIYQDIMGNFYDRFSYTCSINAKVKDCRTISLTGVSMDSVYEDV